MNDRALLILAGIGAVSVLIACFALFVGVVWYCGDTWQRRQTRKALARQASIDAAAHDGDTDDVFLGTVAVLESF